MPTVPVVKRIASGDIGSVGGVMARYTTPFCASVLPNLGQPSAARPPEEHSKTISESLSRPKASRWVREERAGGADRRAGVGRPLGLAGEVHRMDHAGVVPEVDQIVIADDGRRFDRRGNAIFPTDFVAVSVEAYQCAARFHAAGGLAEAEIDVAVTVGDRRAENLTLQLGLPSERAAGGDAVQAFVVSGDHDYLLRRDDGAERTMPT